MIFQMYGFRCSVHGYSVLGENTNLRLEQELAWLSASACRLLVQVKHVLMHKIDHVYHEMNNNLYIESELR